MKRAVASMLLLTVLTSCATINRGRDEVIAVDSNPAGANAVLHCAGNVVASGTTPARLTIPRKADGCRVDIEKSGMAPQKITLERGFNSSYWLNLIPAGAFPVALVIAVAGNSEAAAVAAVALGVFGAAGLIVDRATGAMYDHDPNVIKVTLQPQQRP